MVVGVVVCTRGQAATQCRAGLGGSSQAVQGCRVESWRVSPRWKNLTDQCEEMRGKGPPTLTGTPVTVNSERLGVGRGEGN